MHDNHGLTPTVIGRLVRRHRLTVASYLLIKKTARHDKTRRKYKKVSEPTVCEVLLVVHLAAIRKFSAWKIQTTLKLNVAVRRIQQILSTTPHLRYVKL